MIIDYFAVNCVCIAFNSAHKNEENDENERIEHSISNEFEMEMAAMRGSWFPIIKWL